MARKAAAAVAVIGMVALTGCSTDQASAEIGCEQVVGERLKAPSTAEFNTTMAKDNGDGTWEVRGQVDSENEFGAMVRSTYGCTVFFEDGDAVRATVDVLT